MSKRDRRKEYAGKSRSKAGRRFNGGFYGNIIFTLAAGNGGSDTGSPEYGACGKFYYERGFFAGADVSCICIPDTGHLPIPYQKKSGKADAELQEAWRACDL